MNITKRFITMLLCVLLCAPMARAQQAQDNQVNNTVSQAVTIIIQQEKVRFTAQKAVQEMQLQIFNQSGETVYDSGIISESEINWQLQNANGEAIKSGLYAYTLSIKEVGAETARIRRGHFIVDRAKDRDGEADRLWMTSQDESGVGTELTVAKSEGTTISGTSTLKKKDGAGKSTNLTAEEIPEGLVVKTLNGLTDLVSLEAGANIAITPNGNALTIEAQIAEGQVVKGLNGLMDQVTLEAGENITITPNGNTITIAALGGAGGAYPSITEVDGNIGIGTTNIFPGYRLQVAGSATINPGNGGVMDFGTPNAETGMAIIRGGGRGDLRFDGSTLKLVAGLVGGPPCSGCGVAINTLGNVGIGTTIPQNLLHIGPGRSSILASRVNAVVASNGPDAGIAIAQNSGVNVMVQASGGGGYIGTTSAHPLILRVNDQDTTIMDGFTTTIRAADLRLGHSSRRGAPGRALVDGGVNDLVINFARDWTRTIVGSDLIVDGRTETKSLRITGGSDFAENFDVNVAEAIATKVEAGMVVSIDPTTAGKLALSTQAYDHRVAGIISGAGGVNPGMMMSQEGTLADGKHPVALSGRVYCWVDASQGAIEPGDLLTSSATPGHAMKVTDREKAQGAIIGKAMTSLKAGKGLVLVLVTLQ